MLAEKVRPLSTETAMGTAPDTVAPAENMGEMQTIWVGEMIEAAVTRLVPKRHWTLESAVACTEDDDSPEEKKTPDRVTDVPPREGPAVGAARTG